MTYRATKPTTYVVFWPEIGVIKVGFSNNQRWRAFVLRGAQVVDLFEWDDHRDAFAMETLVQKALSQFGCQLAFRSGAEAQRYLGSRGDGWLECYRLPTGMTPKQILSEIDWKAVA